VNIFEFQKQIDLRNADLLAPVLKGEAILTQHKQHCLHRIRGERIQKSVPLGWEFVPQAEETN